jgi:hypothetical protein
MFKELKYLLYIVIILFFIFLTSKHYFSDLNKKNSYRSLNYLDRKIEKYSSKLIFLKSDTNNIIEYVETKKNPQKKRYYFWNLILNDEK